MLAAKALHDLGYTNVINLQGGFQRWAQSGLPVVKDTPLTARPDPALQPSLPPGAGRREGPAQAPALEGAAHRGGRPRAPPPRSISPRRASAPWASWTATWWTCRTFSVRCSTPRQRGPAQGRLGRGDASSALNPDVKVIPLPTRIDVDNVMDIIKDYDLVIDGSDNFDTRYLVNDACYLAGKTNVHGSIFQFEGMATVFAPNKGPCYRCLYPDAAAAGPRPLLKRGRRPGRAPRHHRCGAGDRGGEAPPRHRRAL